MQMRIVFVLAAIVAITRADLASSKIKILKEDVVAVSAVEKSEENLSAVMEVVAASEDFDCGNRMPVANCQTWSTREGCNAGKANNKACVWQEDAVADLSFIGTQKACADGELFYDGVSAGTVYQQWDLACCKETANVCN